LRTLNDSELIALISGALEPSRALELKEELGPGERQRIALLTARLQRGAEPPRSRWLIPPPGTTAGREPFLLMASPAALMGDNKVAAGDRIEIRLGDIKNPEKHRIVVLFRDEYDWQLVFPTKTLDSLTVADLPETDGWRRLDLVARPEPGTQRWAIALPPTDMTVDAQHLKELERGIANGNVPITSVEFEVAA
jgi:hypothetical protein